MTSLDAKKKYQFEQAPLEKSLADYYPGLSAKGGAAPAEIVQQAMA